MRTKLMIMLTGAVLILAGCGGEAAPTATVTTLPLGGLTVQQVGMQVGCEGTTPAEKQIYTLDAATCQVGDKTLYIFTFSDDTLRDQWLKIAQSFGSDLQVGPGWAVQTE